MTKVKKAVGQTSPAFKPAEKTKRSLMTVPLLPEELITWATTGMGGFPSVPLECQWEKREDKQQR